MPVFDTKTALAGIQHLEDAARMLRDIPELIPVAQRMLEPIFNNGHARVEEQPERASPRKRTMSAAARKRLSIAAKKRWALRRKGKGE